MAAAPIGSPVCARSCYTPIRQLPLNTPASCNAPMTGCSGASLATPLRGVATPMRASRRCAVTAPTEEEDEPNEPMPRTLNLCDCGHCAACATEGSTQSKFLRGHPMRLSDLAGPSPASPGQSPSQEDIPDALTLGASSLRSCAGPTQEIPLCGSPSTVRDPRKRQRCVSLPLVVIPTRSACRAEQPDAPQKVSDPRLFQKLVPTERGALPRTTMLHHSPVSRGNCEPEPLQSAAPCKRRRSPAMMLASPQRFRSATQSASCSIRRYRSPTPVPQHSQLSSRGSCDRYRSPTPVPSSREYSDQDGGKHSLIVGMSL